MSDEQKKPLARHEGGKGGFFHDLSLRVRLILRLMADRRVSFFLKLLPIGTLLYMVVPDIFPGPLDDAAVIWLGTTLFVELCPQDIVQEHMDEMTSVINAEWREIERGSDEDEEAQDSS
jgi:uncharacterized membrane protein YkvA (DUF1232 family)